MSKYPLYSYSTDSILDEKLFTTEGDAIAAAIKEGDWPPLDSKEEREVLADGGYLLIFLHPAPGTLGCSKIVRGKREVEDGP